MVETGRVNAIFQDSRALFADALEELDRGKLRNAAEKASGATKRATDALILARTGDEPRTVGQTTRGLRLLSRQDNRVSPLVRLFESRAHFLHGTCFYDGMCEPPEDVGDEVRETEDYIRDAESLTSI